MAQKKDLRWWVAWTVVVLLNVLLSAGALSLAWWVYPAPFLTVAALAVWTLTLALLYGFARAAAGPP